MKEIIVKPGGFYFEELDESVLCTDCNRPIKKKLVKATGGKVKICYCCDNLAKGVVEVTRHRLDIRTQEFVVKKKVDFKKLREKNRRLYGWYELPKNTNRRKKFN